jgi:hypothetical protein
MGIRFHFCLIRDPVTFQITFLATAFLFEESLSLAAEDERNYGGRQQ